MTVMGIGYRKVKARTKTWLRLKTVNQQAANPVARLHPVRREPQKAHPKAVNQRDHHRHEHQKGNLKVERTQRGKEKERKAVPGAVEETGINGKANMLANGNKTPPQRPQLPIIDFVRLLAPMVKSRACTTSC